MSSADEVDFFELKNKDLYYFHFNLCNITGFEEKFREIDVLYSFHEYFSNESEIFRQTNTNSIFLRETIAKWRRP